MRTDFLISCAFYSAVWPPTGGGTTAGENAIPVWNSAANIGSLLAIVVVVAVVAAVAPWRHAVQTGFKWIRNKSGGWWVLVRLGVAVPITILLVHYKRYLVATFPWFPEWIGEDILAFLAITFAIVQFLDAREEEKDMRAIEEKMVSVVDKMSTRGIGPFPDNLDDIVLLVANAKVSVDIIVDFPGYGQYSEPELHKQYLTALLKAANNPKVSFQLVSYDDVLTREESKMELSAANFNFSRKADKEKLERYLAANKLPLTSPPQTFAALDAMLRQQQDQNVADLAAAVRHPDGLQRKYLSERAPLFLWLVDDREAVFTFKNLEKNDEAYSIRTTDGWLVKNLIVYFEHTYNRAHAAFARTPSYKLANWTSRLQDGSTVVIKGRVNDADGAIEVQSLT